MSTTTNTTPSERPQSADDLDLDAWLDDLQLPSKTVVIYQRGDLADRAADLEARIATARRRLAALATDDGDTSDPDAAMSDGGDIEDPQELQRQLDGLADQLRASGRRLTLHGLSQVHHSRLFAECTDPTTGKFDGAAFTIRALAASLGIDEQQVRRLAERISVGEFGKLVKAMDEVTSGSVDLPL